MSSEYHTFHIHSQFIQLLGHIRRSQLGQVVEILGETSASNPISLQILHLRDRNGRTALHHCADTLIPSPETITSTSQYHTAPSIPLDPKSRFNQLFEIAQYLIKCKPELVESQDNEGNTALHLSVINGNLILTKLLIRNMTCDQINQCDYERHTAVHWATVCGELECLAVLLDTGTAEVSTPDIYGAHPLHYATQFFPTGADLERRNGTGLSGYGFNYYYGVTNKQKYSTRRANGLRILHYLLSQMNVDVNCTDNEGRTPLLWAASSGELFDKFFLYYL